MSAHHKINYIEFPSSDLTKTKSFFGKVFGWKFVDYGPDYSSIVEAGIDGGFYLSDSVMQTDNGSALIVLYSVNLEETEKNVKEAGGKIIKPIFGFPGGRRFHFADLNGSEFAVWSEK